MPSMRMRRSRLAGIQTFSLESPHASVSRALDLAQRPMSQMRPLRLDVLAGVGFQDGLAVASACVCVWRGVGGGLQGTRSPVHHSPGMQP